MLWLRVMCVRFDVRWCTLCVSIVIRMYVLYVCTICIRGMYLCMLCYVAYALFSYLWHARMCV